MSVPQEQIDDAHLLNADGYVHLYEIETTSGTLYLKADNDADWQSNTYSGTAIKLDGRNRSTDGEKSRPNLTMANVGSVYSLIALNGGFDNCLVTEKRVLYQHLLANQNIYLQRRWKGRLVTALNRISVTLQLRDFMDGPRFILPGRQFNPPDFPSVLM